MTDPIAVRHRVLVTDGEQRAALAVVRSLGRAGHDVLVTSARRKSLAGASRFAKAEATVADALAQPQAFVREITALIAQWRIDTVIPITEPAMLAVLPAKDTLGASVPFPPIDIFRAVSDKQAVLEQAATLGIAVPRQLAVPAPDQIAQAVRDWKEFPAVLKPARSVSAADGVQHKLTVTYADTADQLDHRLRALPAAAFPVLLQQRVIGPGIGIFLLLRDGRIQAVFAHRRIREKPPAGGVSVYRESVAADPKLVQISAELLNRFGWEGVAMIEYKVDAATATPYLMEINGRFWGSLQLAIDAGVDFPVLLLRSMRGEALVPAPYRTGIRSRWWWGDVDQLLTRLRHSADSLSLPPDAPSRTRSVLDFLKLWRPGDRNEIFRWTDPKPLLRETIDWLTSLH